MPDSSTAPRPLPTSIAALARVLRDGPLECLAALKVKANALADGDATSERERLEDLEELVQLAHVTMSRFHDFTDELRRLLEHAAARSAERH